MLCRINCRIGVFKHLLARLGQQGFLRDQGPVTGVDDLWHAAIAGRSQFVNARDPLELQTGMASILNEIKNTQAARAGAAFSNVNFAKDNNFIYRVTIEPGWGGTLTKVLVDPSGGGEIAISTKYHDILAAQLTQT